MTRSIASSPLRPLEPHHTFGQGGDVRRAGPAAAADETGTRGGWSRTATGSYVDATIRTPEAPTAISLCGVVSQPDAGEIELLVLAALASAGSTTSSMAQQLGQPAETIRAAVLQLRQGGLVEAAGDSVTLTPAGRLVASHAPRTGAPTGAGNPAPTIDLGGAPLDGVTVLGALWPADAGRAAAEKTARDGLLASDADRDATVQLLSDAFVQGRLSSSELEQRTAGALSARTYGELDDVLQGLGGLPRQVSNHPVRTAVFWVIALLCSPFVLLGVLLLAFGSDAGDRVGGIVLLVLLLPGLFKLRRWAAPRG